MRRERRRVAGYSEGGGTESRGETVMQQKCSGYIEQSGVVSFKYVFLKEEQHLE